MSAGILGWFHSHVSGEASRGTKQPDIFADGTVGGGWQKYLLDLYKTPTADTPQFLSQSGALRDLLAKQYQGQAEQFGQATNAGGFYDSGARLAGLQGINRAQMFSYSQGLSEMLAKMEAQKMQAAYPFLQAQLQQRSVNEQIQANASNEANWRDAQLGQGLSSMGSGLGGGDKTTTKPTSTYGADTNAANGGNTDVQFQ